MTAWGKWIPVREILSSGTIPAAELRQQIVSGAVLSKIAGGEELVFVEESAPPTAVAEPAAPKTEPEPPAPSAPVPAPEPAAAPEPAPPAAISRAETLPGEPLVSRLTHAQELAVQTERALSLVERSMSAFMLMHKEVVSEKERSYENYKQTLDDRAQEIKEKEAELEALRRTVREREQEIADLKMLVEILEGRVQREAAPPSPEHLERASVGDLMEDQLRYLMEDQMIKELLK